MAWWTYATVPREKGSKIESYDEWIKKMGFAEKEVPQKLSGEQRAEDIRKANDVMKHFIGHAPQRLMISEELGI